MANSKKTQRGVDPAFDYKKYWEERYAKGQSSGKGSYGLNAEFKAQIIDRVIQENSIKSVVDFGCGDGNQISLIQSDIEYVGFDVSQTTIDNCNKKFDKPLWSFNQYDPMTYTYAVEKDMSMCLDCLFHITIEEEWLKTIDCICKSAKKIILLVTNTESIREDYFPHVNLKYKIMPHLDQRDDVIIDEVITQPTHPESNTIILRKV